MELTLERSRDGNGAKLPHPQISHSRWPSGTSNCFVPSASPKMHLKSKYADYYAWSSSCFLCVLETTGFCDLLLPVLSKIGAAVLGGFSTIYKDPQSRFK
jgi:hypothetical protein